MIWPPLFQHLGQTMTPAWSHINRIISVISSVGSAADNISHADNKSSLLSITEAMWLRSEGRNVGEPVAWTQLAGIEAPRRVFSACLESRSTRFMK